MTETARANTAPAPASAQWPEVQPIGIADILEVLAAGLRDFRAAPSYSLFFGGIYAVGGWALILLLLYFDPPYLVYPLAMGCALIAGCLLSGRIGLFVVLPVLGHATWHLYRRAVAPAPGAA